ncbi:Uncharacterised protein [Mycobacteroides abscessus]|nr:Uncharacterised protein [Mycobacteroides abscessus]
MSHSFASRAASSQLARCGRSAASAAESEHPVPWVWGVSTRSASNVVTVAAPGARPVVGPGAGTTSASGDVRPVR